MMPWSFDDNAGGGVNNGNGNPNNANNNNRNNLLNSFSNTNNNMTTTNSNNNVMDMQAQYQRLLAQHGGANTTPTTSTHSNNAVQAAEDLYRNYMLALNMGNTNPMNGLNNSTNNMNILNALSNLQGLTNNNNGMNPNMNIMNGLTQEMLQQLMLQQLMCNPYQYAAMMNAMNYGGNPSNGLNPTAAFIQQQQLQQHAAQQLAAQNQPVVMQQQQTQQQLASTSSKAGNKNNNNYLLNVGVRNTGQSMNPSANSANSSGTARNSKAANHQVSSNHITTNLSQTQAPLAHQQAHYEYLSKLKEKEIMHAKKEIAATSAAINHAKNATSTAAASTLNNANTVNGDTVKPLTISAPSTLLSNPLSTAVVIPTVTSQSKVNVDSQSDKKTIDVIDLVHSTSPSSQTIQLTSSSSLAPEVVSTTNSPDVDTLLENVLTPENRLITPTQANHRFQHALLNNLNNNNNNIRIGLPNSLMQPLQQLSQQSTFENEKDKTLLNSNEPTKRMLSKDEKQRLLRDATDLTRKLLRLYAVLDLDVLVLVCDMERGQVVDKKTSCVELLVAANELTTTINKPDNPLHLAMDIHTGKRSIFPRNEVRPDMNPLMLATGNSNNSTTNTSTVGSSSNGSNIGSIAGSIPIGPLVGNPYDYILVKHDVQRGDVVREIAVNYTSMYRKSNSNNHLSVKEAPIIQVEDLLRNYYRDGYRLSPGIKAYLTSNLCERIGQKLPSIQMQKINNAPSKTSLYPICWDVSSVPAAIKSSVYKIVDGRNSEEAKQRARNLVLVRKNAALKRKSDREHAMNGGGGPSTPNGGDLDQFDDDEDVLDEDDEQELLGSEARGSGDTNDRFSGDSVEEEEPNTRKGKSKRKSSSGAASKRSANTRRGRGGKKRKKNDIDEESDKSDGDDELQSLDEHADVETKGKAEEKEESEDDEEEVIEEDEVDEDEDDISEKRPPRKAARVTRSSAPTKSKGAAKSKSRGGNTTKKSTTKNSAPTKKARSRR